MRDQREVSQVTLDGWIQDLRRSSVAERGSVLVQQVHQLLDDHPEIKTGLVLGSFVNLAFFLPVSCLPAILFSVESPMTKYLLRDLDLFFMIPMDGVILKPCLDSVN
jgi:hypothetical protein